MARLPQVERAVIERVMDEWDQDIASPQWHGFNWQRPGRQKAAVRYNGRLYPLTELVRRVVHSRTGAWLASLPHREAAVNYICHTGLTVMFAPFIKPYDGPPRPRPHYTIVLRPDGAGWFAEMPALPACYADGATVEEALRELQVVYQMIMEDFDDEGLEAPPDVCLQSDASAA